ncbi:hypothetical protein ACFX43_09740 [Nocardioides sp. YIM B13467]|uniref:hypothetical protein n=1 Tax=Nocardioides sp. YIM B13467 TaxID=3366294 RepID=UPI00366BE933
MSDKSTDGEAPEPVQPAVEQPAPAAYAPPTYGPPTAAAAVPVVPVAPVAPVSPTPKKKLSERVFGWKSVAAAAAVGLVLGGGVVAGVVAAVVDGGDDQGPRELGQMRDQMPYGQTPDGGQMPDFGQGGGGPGGFGQQLDRSDGQSSQGQSS